MFVTKTCTTQRGVAKGKASATRGPNTLHAAASIVSVVLIDISYVVQGFRTSVVAAIVCTTECVHTLRVARTVPLVALHTLLAHCLRHTSRCGHTTSLSAPSLLFPCGQRDWSAVPGFLSDVSRPKISRQAHSDIGDVEFGYLATSFHLTSHEPKLSDKMITADDDATPINDPDHDNISDFSKTTNDNTRRFGVPTVIETFVSQISR